VNRLLTECDKDELRPSYLSLCKQQLAAGGWALRAKLQPIGEPGCGVRGFLILVKRWTTAMGGFFYGCRMNKKTIEAINAHALAEYPREAVGFVVAKGRKEMYVPGVNVAAEPEDYFATRPQDWVQAQEQGELIAFVHSHPNMPAVPSQADRVACEAMAEHVKPLEWLIVSVMPGDDGPRIEGMESFCPEGYQAPLIGRQFYHGVLDCYTLIQDFYRRERAIALPDFERGDGWWEGGDELYLDNFAEAGFVEVEDGPKTGDVILMQLRSERVNHAGIYLGAEPLAEASYLHPVPDAMLHHAYGYLSERVPYGGYWAQITRKIIRHKELL